MQSFYADLLNFTVLESSHSSFTLRVGESEIHFEEHANAKPYHFAFDIPHNLVNEALHWLQQRLEVYNFEGQVIQQFTDWNAEAMYFHDPDQNIVEFIARHNKGLDSDQEFGSQSLIGLSEIGLASKDLPDIVNQLKKTCGLEIYRGDSERFAAIGDEDGLFICVNPELKRWFPTGEEVLISPFEMEFSQAGMDYMVKYDLGSHLNIKSL